MPIRYNGRTVQPNLVYDWGRTPNTFSVGTLVLSVSPAPVATPFTTGAYSGYTITGTATLDITQGNSDFEYVVVAGGGAGGNGGGGAGGYLTGTITNVWPGSYPIVVGAGGTSSGPSVSTDGSNSSITLGSTTVTALGGGAGAMGTPAGGSPGGSGGGGYWYSVTMGMANVSFYSSGGGNGTPGQGNPGGAGAYPPGRGGGGGGAGEPGGTDGLAYGGDGATTTITGTPLTLAGGGGGSFTPGVYPSPTNNSGAGGGGRGYGPPTLYATPGTVNTGGGGGGGQITGPPSPPNGLGGSGVVIIRWLTQ